MAGRIQECYLGIAGRCAIRYFAEHAGGPYIIGNEQHTVGYGRRGRNCFEYKRGTGYIQPGGILACFYNAAQ